MSPVQLLKLEWKKFSPNGTFRAVGALYAASFAMVLLLARSAGRNMTFTMNGTTTHPLAGVFAYPRDWELLASIGSWMNLFVLGFLGVYMITMEFSNRTLRQSVIFGMTRQEAAAGKLIWSAALALAATGYYVLVVVAGEVLGGGGFGIPIAGSIGCFFLQALGYLLLGTLAGLLIRQTALATVSYLAYVMILETVFRWVVYFTVAKSRLLLFFPNHVLGSLTPMPVPEMVNRLANANPYLKSLSPEEAVLAAVVYVGVFAVIFCRRIVKSDL